MSRVSSYSNFSSVKDQEIKVLQDWVTNKGYNPMEVPKFRKVVLNVGFGSEIGSNPKVVQTVELMLSSIGGQKPIITKARKAIAGFKIKRGQPVGASVTLRGRRMYSFLDRLIIVALPRVKDFRGLPKGGFDAAGNYNFGIRDCSIFPEVPADKMDKFRGLDVTICLNSKSPDDSFQFLKQVGFPFRK
ncbi:MAG: 50S ribosomal protein L5 [Deltaproteobacteria bacterium]|nr:50S ribosomal protein L5 [Deltaproteobacteria bacterium]